MIANHNVHRILVDNGSSADTVLVAFEKLKLSRDKIVSVHFPLMGFTGKQVQSLGSIELPLTIGAILEQVTIMVKFLLSRLSAGQTKKMLRAREKQGSYRGGGKIALGRVHPGSILSGLVGQCCNGEKVQRQVENVHRLY
jgi:hypothetical protein